MSLPPFEDKLKQSLYFRDDIMRSLREEARRQKRSLSWLVQKAWVIALPTIVRFPSDPCDPVPIPARATGDK